MKEATQAERPQPILVVEDDPAIARDYCESIRERGYTVACAYSTDEALKIARRRPPAFAVLDIRLNGERNGGIMVAVSLNRWFHVPHVYVTAYGKDRDTIKAAAETHPVGILNKPQSEESILRRIEQGLQEEERKKSLPHGSWDQWIGEFAELQASDMGRAGDLLVQQLEDRRLDDEWIEDLVLLAEDTQFSPEQDGRLAPRLLEAATVLRDNESAAYSTTVWSAIRAYASMLAPEEIESLAELLTEPGEHAVDTLLVTLKSLRRLLESRPPTTFKPETALTKKVIAIAEAYLDGWVLTPGTNAAIAQNTVLILTALGSPAVLEMVKRIKSLGIQWFELQLAGRLRETREHWLGEGRCGEHGPVQFAQEVLECLKP